MTREEDFPPELKEELLDLVEVYGGFKDLKALASYFGITPSVLSRYMASPEYQSAASRHRPETRAAAIRNAQLTPDSAQELAFLDDTDDPLG